MTQPALDYPTLFRSGNQKTTVYLRRSVGGYALVAEVTVSRRTAQSLRTQFDTIRSIPDYDSAPEIFELAAEAVLALAAPDLVAAIGAIKDRPGPLPELFIIRGFHLSDDPVATPLDGIVDLEAVKIEAVVLAGVARHFGLTGVAYGDENKSRLLRAVCPVADTSNTASSQGAAADLTDHADNSHRAIPNSDDIHPNPYPMMNTHQFFATITPKLTIPMRVKMNADVFARFDPRGSKPMALAPFRRLFEGLFSFPSPPSQGGVTCTDGLPVLVNRDSGGWAMRFRGDLTRASDPQSEEALEMLKFALASTKEEVIYTQRGDIIGYLNISATHRRESFKAKFDGADRFYLRLYGLPREVQACNANRMGPNGRVM